MKKEMITYIGNNFANVIADGILDQFYIEPRDIILKARGKHISKAVDVLEILKRELNINNSNISTQTDELISQEGNLIKVSQITISLKQNEVSNI